MRGKKRRNYISRQACFVNRFTLQGFNFFPSHNIYSALLQRIEHSSTRKSTCRLPIYLYIYIYIYIHLSIYRKSAGRFSRGRVLNTFFPLIIFIYIYIYIYIYPLNFVPACLLFQFLLAIISFCLITNPGVLCSLFYVIFSFNTPKRF